MKKKIAEYCGAKYAVAVNSATSALHIACLSLGLGSKDILWTSPITFVASANVGLYCGAKVDFVDIDSATANISIPSLREKLRWAKKNGCLPKVLVAVHMGGQSCDMQSISLLSERYGFKVIEDASHAIGGKYLSLRIGSCRYSDITIFSFHPVKIITTAEGGMALTNDPELAHKMNLLRSHGITRDPKYMTAPSEGGWAYQQIELGFNYRMTDLQAALGISQLNRLDEYVEIRNKLASTYNSLLVDLPVAVPTYHPDCYSSFHLYVVRVLDKSKRKFIFDFLVSNGIGVNVHYFPVHLQPYYLNLGFKRGDFPEAEKYYSEALTLPLFPGLSDLEQMRIVSTLRLALNG